MMGWQLLWRCLLQFGGLPPPVGPCVRPILDAVTKQAFPWHSSWGLHAHSYTPSPAGSSLQLQFLLHEPFNTWSSPHPKFWIKWILQNLGFLPNTSPLGSKENIGEEGGSKNVRGFESRTCFISEDFQASLLHFIKTDSLFTNWSLTIWTRNKVICFFPVPFLTWLLEPRTLQQSSGR